MDETHEVATRKRITSVQLRKPGLVGCWTLGVACVAVGGIATFASDNQAGTTAFTALGGVLLFLGITGRVPLSLEVGNTKMDATYFQDSAFLAGRESALDDLPRPERIEDDNQVSVDDLAALDLDSWENALFSSTWACKLSLISYRQLDYWARTGLVTPATVEVDAKGGRVASTYNLRDVISLAATNRMLSLGISLQQIRIAVERLTAIPIRNLSNTVIIFELSENVSLTTVEDALIQVQKGVTGAVVPLGLVVRDVYNRLRDYPLAVDAVEGAGAGL